MSKGEFSLLTEPWIRVITLEGEVKEVSLLEVFEYAHEYRALAGELPTQDVAILRLLLAVLYATFTRVDVQGGFAAVTTADEAFDRWVWLKDAGAFPIEPIKARLLPYADRFYLFHPERPFCQVATMTKGTDYQVAKLIGDLSESSNKVRLFPTRTGKGKKSLTNAEAARWLLYLNGYDDTSAKPSVRGGGLPSVGAGWLGKLGLVFVEGDTLFETLLLNFVLLDDGGTPFKISRATWELDEVRQAEREEIAIPIDPLKLLTLQSRRVLLKREEGTIVGYLLLGGDFFDKENAFIEQMTMWRKDSTAKEEVYIPKRHSETRQVWREFSSLLAGNAKDAHSPGIVSWMAKLQNNKLLEQKWFRLRVAGIQYADKDFYVDGIISDSLTMSAGLLTSLESDWVIEIGDRLVLTDQCVWQLGILALDVSKALGNDDEKSRKGISAAARERAFFALDMPFRRWLAGLDPYVDKHSKKLGEWTDQMKTILMDIANRLVDEAGEKAIVGIYKTGENATEIANVARALRKFRSRLFQLCKEYQGKENG
jgi:CRISPR system Cascade subunit CasA